ncbi:transcriptional regulator [Actinomadura decatromicini]|uniref:Transcriptional regulator n=1 Tax=Actinomadura decatromicini TaxID=2604572 RepID=A0A5D3FQS8_9ACTN|nr:transcriptional regulator [Actinomadura decatromicini]TYK50392.1 transcriptional regulator [Actinomadura decatromicini]
MAAEIADERVAHALGALERERSTGLLRIGDDGAFQIVRGAVAHAESRHAPGPGEPPDGSGRELPELLAVFDAAYFLLGSAAEPDFTEGPPSARPRRITAATLVHERRRRRGLLDAAWPDAGVDVAPVVPVRRVRRQRVILTGVQAEILLNADGRRTPADLAAHLGRTAFGCLLAVRGLAAASLLRTEHQSTRRRPPAPSGIPAGWAPADRDLLVRLHTALTELG